MELFFKRKVSIRKCDDVLNKRVKGLLNAMMLEKVRILKGPVNKKDLIIQFEYTMGPLGNEKEAWDILCFSDCKLLETQLAEEV